MSKAVKVLNESDLREVLFGVSGSFIKCVVEENRINRAEIHNDVSDLFFVVSGKTTFICDGNLVNPEKSLDDQNTLLADSMINGVEYNLVSGDWFLVPENCSHQRTTQERCCFVVIKIPKINNN